MTLKGNLTLSMGFYGTWKMRACIWELLSLLERCWASSTWTESCDLHWACSKCLQPPFFMENKFVSCRSCWACSARLDLSPLGKIPELPNVRISVWPPSNTAHRSEVQLWLKLVEFLPWFHLGLSQNFVQESSSQGSCGDRAAPGPSSSLAASLGSSGALLASPGDSEQLHPGAVCQWSSNPHQFGG